jgi:hypothetical protein
MWSVNQGGSHFLHGSLFMHYCTVAATMRIQMRRIEPFLCQWWKQEAEYMGIGHTSGQFMRQFSCCRVNRIGTNDNRVDPGCRQSHGPGDHPAFGFLGSRITGRPLRLADPPSRESSPERQIVISRVGKGIARQ